MQCEYRSAREGDVPALRELWKEAFGDGDRFLDQFFEGPFAPERSRVAVVEGHKMPGVGSSHGDHPFCRSVCQFVRLFQLYAISLAKSSKKEERTWQPHVLFLWTNPGALWGQLQICSNQKAREFARSRSHRPASFCWCVREAAPCTPRNSTLLSCTHMPGNCPKNVKQGLLQNVFFATDSVLKVKDSGRKHRNSCLLPLKY